MARARLRTVGVLALLLVGIAWAFFAYHFVRTRSGPLGSDPVRMVADLLGSLLTIAFPPYVILPPIVIAAPLIVVAIAVVDHVRYARRFSGRGGDERCCFQCGYPATGLQEERCPECGSSSFGTRTEYPKRNWSRVLLLIAVGWLLGCATAEVCVSLDEMAFKREAMASGQTEYLRRRWWPMTGGEMVYNNGQYWNVDD